MAEHDSKGNGQGGPASSHKAFDSFVETIAALRAPDGCPWDREQTHESIAHNMIEEAFEAVDAIESGDTAHLREELGDVLLQVVLQSQIAADAGEFTIDDVCRDVDAKMIRRHPHVFGDRTASDSAEVLDIWDSVKMQEKQSADAQASERAGLLEGVPTSFPALMQAQKISRKAAAAGFEWDDADGVWRKVAEEIEEFKAAANADEAEDEFGDILFALVNVARWHHVDAEGALRRSCAKFRRRWSFIEGAAWAKGCDVSELSMDEMEGLWQQAKARE
ncbi:nucleoside triphosphate pyrophosphohydrolase [Slackia faecicanis]|uniref:Nucleoside triphosphate pyrophosphohydrolase n=1 Tax=Slackia faecicanis TaxID=255723 RepID=A0A3N0AEB6_9ACTN|nr:nucleoside triphosphate pyrophosphohydrolase [Slackia faecicanis]RNL19585.1 nucleoside triphosphate pyrophosphohydrolase [Slackia faecicanis]